MKRRIMLVISVIIVIIFSVSYNQQQTVFDEGQFFYEIGNAKLPTYFPFEIDNFSYYRKFSMVKYPTFFYGSKEDENPKKTIQVNIFDRATTDTNLSLEVYAHYSESNLLEFNGTKALYNNNGIIQMLSWEDDEVVYDLILQAHYANKEDKPREPFEISEILKIAASFKKIYNQQQTVFDDGQIFYEIRNAKLPTYFPFEVNNFKYFNKIKATKLPTINYFNYSSMDNVEPRITITVTICDPVITQKSCSIEGYSHYSESNLLEYNGIKALYLNNGNTQMLSWEDDGIVYDLTLEARYANMENKPKEPFKISEILKIAASFKIIN